MTRQKGTLLLAAMLVAGISATASCWHCAKETKVRWGCEKCDLALCRRCVGNTSRREEFLKEHQTKQPDHRSYFGIYPPHWTTKQHWIEDKCPCLTSSQSTIFHCERCHIIMGFGEACYNCRTCSAEFGASQTLCPSCYNQEDQTHLLKHQWMTTAFAKTQEGSDELDKDMKLYFNCQQCPESKSDFCAPQRHNLTLEQKFWKAGSIFIRTTT